MPQYNWTNVSKVIKAEVNTLQSEFERILAQNLLGIYLYGSLALGDFQPARSDIDVVAVVAEPIAVTLQRELVEMLLRISNMPRPLDIYVLAEKDLFPFQPPLPFALHYNEQVRETLQLAIQNGAWQHWNAIVHEDIGLTISLAIIQRVGIALAGRPPKDTLPVISDAAFRDALVQTIEEARAQLPQDPIMFVLNACRTLAFLHDGSVLSKDAGGEWGLLHLPERFHALLQQALAFYRGDTLKRPVGRAVLDDFASYVSGSIRGGDTRQ